MAKNIEKVYFYNSYKTIKVIDMENGLSFERKISFEPLLISIILGLVIGIIIWSIFPKYLLLGIILGIVSFILESLLIYPKYLSELYDYWYVDTQGDSLL
ncbi:MAG TPA: hypothetical protein DEQ50_01350 [Lactobacillus sp.]|nr:hypothetical protein [Lactobacillus sp.]